MGGSGGELVSGRGILGSGGGGDCGFVPMSCGRGVE